MPYDKLHYSRRCFTYISQVSPELQEEAASVVTLYEGFCAHVNAMTVKNVQTAAAHLINQFSAAAYYFCKQQKNSFLNVFSVSSVFMSKVTEM